MRFRRGSLADNSWEKIYADQFPASEQQPLEVLQYGIWFNVVHLHETCNAEAKCLCFSLTTDFKEAEFLLLAYIAVEKGLTGSGVGTVHLASLIKELGQQFPTYKGIFVEIEDPTCESIDDETRKIREARLRFYEKLGVKPLPVSYWIPNFGNAGKHPDKLLYIPLNVSTDNLSLPDIAKCIASIFVMAYGLTPSTDIFRDVVGTIDADTLQRYCQLEKENNLPSLF